MSAAAGSPDHDITQCRRSGYEARIVHGIRIHHRLLLLPGLSPRSAERRPARAGLDGVGPGQGRQAPFDKHAQPKVPKWGYEDESDPAVMARKIDAAADHRIDTLLFDWYWYDGPFLNAALDKGFLQAANNNRLQFALMWANHDWLDIHPAKLTAPAAAGLSRAGSDRRPSSRSPTRSSARTSSTRRTGGSTAGRTSPSTRCRHADRGASAASRRPATRCSVSARRRGPPGCRGCISTAVIWGIRPPAGREGARRPRASSPRCWASTA